ncbi:Trans-4-hydroxy-L-proline dehydratase [Commensalibacter sp. Nvir]|uniref:glycyl radical protein n=1 Tax=Commensalibacter sp. Nvir TaxID=3069817 RepID=UPI002D57BD8B|nr:Trans-4-hydroxy-L-proline dehydratase [Commensalibacter sp. Nvir]
MIEKGFSRPTLRILKLKEAILNAKPEVESDRAKLVTEAYKETENLPPILRRAKALEKILTHLPITIRDHELIVGSATKHIRSASVFPEYSFAWIEDEFDTMEHRKADPSIIPKEVAQTLHEAFTYWPGKTVSDLGNCYLSDEAKQCMAEGVFTVGNYLNGGVGHTTVDYGKILKIGFRGIIDEVTAVLDKQDKNAPEYPKKKHFYNAIIIAYSAAIQFAKRYAEKARQMAELEADQVRKNELLTIASICNRVPEYGATNFYEACQSFWFVQLLIQIESSGHSISPGRFDQYMYPYLVSDKTISKEAAQELVDCIWIKLNDLNKCRDELSAQAFAGYAMFQNLIIGGQTQDGIDATNEISYMCMEATAHVALPQPSFSARVWQGTPDEFLFRTCEVIRLGLGVPAMYNDEVIIPAMQNRHVSLEDARNYSIIGCVEPSVPHRTEGQHDAAFFNMAKIFEVTLNNGRLNGKQFGPQTGEMESFKDTDTLLNAFQKQLEYFVKLLVEACNCADMAHAERAPLPFLSALVEDCTARGKSVQEGGAIYNFTGPQAFGVSDSADSIYAIQKQVFEDHKITMTQLKAALEANFNRPFDRDAIKSGSAKQFDQSSGRIDTQANSDFESIRRVLDNTPSYGNDIDEVDLIARKCAQLYCREVEKYKNPRNGQFQAGIYPVSANVMFGRYVGAMPNGRPAQAPLADGVSPRQGKDVNGPTAAANSVSKLDHFLASNGTLYNQKFLPSSLAGDNGLKNFSSMLRTYFDKKGMHIQFNVVDRETLIAAQQNPSKYKDLVVRVAGYSAQFITLAKDVQDDIISRTEQHF